MLQQVPGIMMITIMIMQHSQAGMMQQQPAELHVWDAAARTAPHAAAGCIDGMIDGRI